MSDSGGEGHCTCRELINNFLVEYMHGDLPSRERSVFEQHLAECPPCVEYIECYKKTIEAARKSCCHVRNPELAHVPDELIRAILAARNTPS